MCDEDLKRLLKRCSEKEISECVNYETCGHCEIFIEFMKEKEKEND